MKFSCDQEALQGALQHLGKVAPTRSTLPILSSILMSTEDGKLKLCATDLEISQVIELPADIYSEGSVAVSHRTLLDITTEMPTGDLQIEVSDDRKLQLSTNFGSYSIMGKPAEEFPALPILDNKSEIALESELLRNIIEKTSFAVSKDELKPSLMGVLFSFGEEDLKAVATDGHRLVRFVKTGLQPGGYVGDNIIPVKFLSILATYLAADEQVSFNISDRHIMVSIGNTTLYTRIIEERFPDYESVFPVSSDKKLFAQRADLLSAVRRVSIFSNKTTHQIAFNLTNNQLMITTEDIETISTARETLSCDYGGDELVIGYNSAYLRDIIAHLDTDEVIGEFTSAVSAALFFGSGKDDSETLTMLLMPIRLND